MKLDVLADAIRMCKRCELSKLRENAVPGEGDSRAKIMFVGEAPGKAEDISGKPFFGRAGELLNEGLIIANLHREDVFITSVLKCRPPDNRLPKSKEIKSCMPYLEQQIDIVKPDVIVLLGRTAAKSVFGKGSISKLHGKFVNKEGRKYFITYHPAAALRSTATRNLFFKDMELLR